MKRSLLPSLVLALTLAPAAAWAQPRPAQPPAAASEETIQFTGEDLRRFVIANRDVERIRSSYSAQLGAAIGNPQKTAAVQQQANQAMVAAVQSAGISMTLYNQIVAVASQTPQLDQHLKQLQTALEAGQGQSPAQPAKR